MNLKQLILLHDSTSIKLHDTLLNSIQNEKTVVKTFPTATPETKDKRFKWGVQTDSSILSVC